jgi:hypothetical protein
MKVLLMFLIIPFCATAQWPGYFYTFTLSDSAGKLISTKSIDYKITPLKPAEGRVLLQIDMCTDNKTLRFYEGYKDFDTIQQLQIVKLNSKSSEIMIIEFPPSLSRGKEKFYRNLYAGNLVFRKGIYRIKLPDSDVGWDNLQEKHFCPDYGGVDTYYDISSLQKK